MIALCEDKNNAWKEQTTTLTWFNRATLRVGEKQCKQQRKKYNQTNNQYIFRHEFIYHLKINRSRYCYSTTSSIKYMNLLVRNIYQENVNMKMFLLMPRLWFLSHTKFVFIVYLLMNDKETQHVKIFHPISWYTLNANYAPWVITKSTACCCDSMWWYFAICIESLCNHYLN